MPRAFTEAVCKLSSMRVTPPSSLPGSALDISSSCNGDEFCLWASVQYLIVFHASISKMCPNVIASLPYAILDDKIFLWSTLFSGTQWTWAWANSGRQWITGKPGMLLSIGSQSVGHNWMTEQQQFSGSGEACISWKLKESVKNYSLGRKKDKMSLESFQKWEHTKMKTSTVISKGKKSTWM